MTPAASLKVGTRLVPLTNLDKPLYPGGFTKGDVVGYYSRIAPAMIPYLRDRAVTLKRYPNGVQAPFFFEKNCSAHRPPWIKTVDINGGSAAGGNTHCVLGEAASLVWAANLAALEIHVPLAKSPNFDRPTMMVYDLDPGPDVTLSDCIELAIALRDLLANLELQSFAKLSGSKGLHLYVPLNSPGVTFDQTKEFAHAVALLLEQRNAARVTSVMSKAKRSGKVFVDWSQNDRHKTTACAYTLRATDEPQVSAPMRWDELESAAGRKTMSPRVFAPDTVVHRFEEQGDLFLPVLKLKQKLPKPRNGTRLD